MKTHANQIITIVSFFTMSLITTLVISWAMTDIIDSSSQEKIGSGQSVQVIHMINIDTSLNNTIKVLLPQSIHNLSR